MAVVLLNCVGALGPVAAPAMLDDDVLKGVTTNPVAAQDEGARERSRRGAGSVGDQGGPAGRAGGPGNATGQGGAQASSGVSASGFWPVSLTRAEEPGH